MTERNPPVWMQSGTYNAADDRMVTSLLSDRTIAANGMSYSIEGGVLPALSELRVTGNGTNMTITVSPGMVIVPAGLTSPPGAYLCYNEGNLNITLDIASTTNPRNDVIFAEVQDQAAGGTTSLWRIGVLKGTPSASPTDPALTKTQVKLATVQVKPAAQNGGVNKVMQTQVTDQRRFATALGGVHVRWGGNWPAHSPGRLTYDTTSKLLYVSDGSVNSEIMTKSSYLAGLKHNSPAHVATATVGYRNYDQGEGWTEYLYADHAGRNRLSELKLTTSSPTGDFLVTLQGIGQVEPKPLTADSQINKTNLCMTVGMFKADGTMIYAGNTSWAANQFRSEDWESNSATFLLNFGQPNVAYTFKVRWYFQGGAPAAGNTAQQDASVRVYNHYLMVQPVF